MVEFTLPKNSKVGEGKTWPHAGERPRPSANIRIYRWDPDDGAQSAHRHLLRRPRRLRADGARRADLDQEQDRPDADLPPLLPRGHLRLLRHEYRRHQHARLHQGDGATCKGRCSIYPLPHMPVVKDLVPDLTTFYAQHASIEPWLQTDTPTPREGMAAERPTTAPSSTGSTNASCAPAARPRARAIGGTASAISAPRRCCRPIAGSSIRRDEATGERLDDLEDPFRLYRCHTIMNCAKTCPKGLNPAKAIAEIKKMMVERQV